MSIKYYSVRAYDRLSAVNIRKIQNTMAFSQLPTCAIDQSQDLMHLKALHSTETTKHGNQVLWSL